RPGRRFFGFPISATIIGLIFAFLLVVDPYDTGRFPTPLPTGVVDIERRTATVSRGRDPRFNAAIFGNSRTFMLPANNYFPALEPSDVWLSELPPQAKFVIMMPPVYQTNLPHAGTQDAADLVACMGELARRLGRQGIALLDYLVDGPISRDPENFM